MAKWQGSRVISGCHATLAAVPGSMPSQAASIWPAIVGYHAGFFIIIEALLMSNEIHDSRAVSIL
ncbi:hypothetical protein CAP48_00800 [Advenella sp. S44]|nr:hypothetical protein CAP48_00800 [Advenella sp. S44]